MVNLKNDSDIRENIERAFWGQNAVQNFSDSRKKDIFAKTPETFLLRTFS